MRRPGEYLATLLERAGGEKARGFLEREDWIREEGCPIEPPWAPRTGSLEKGFSMGA